MIYWVNESSLSKFKKVNIDQNIISNYKLSHLRAGDNIKSVGFFNNNNLVAYVSVEDKSLEKWIQALEVSKEYRNQGIGKELLDYAVKKLKARYLSVRKTNKIAIHMYEKYGFKIYDDTGYMYFMRLEQ